MTQELDRLEKIESDISQLKEIVQGIRDRLFDDESELELKDEVEKEVEEARREDKEISNDDVVNEFSK